MSTCAPPAWTGSPEQTGGLAVRKLSKASYTHRKKSKDFCRKTILLKKKNETKRYRRKEKKKSKLEEAKTFLKEGMQTKLGLQLEKNELSRRAIARSNLFRLYIPTEK